MFLTSLMPPAVCPPRLPRLFAQSPVVSVCSSKDGMKLAVGTSAGSIGVLDVMTHGYTTCLRSHRGGVTAAAIDPSEERDEFATVSQDCTLRYAERYNYLERLHSAVPVVTTFQ